MSWNTENHYLLCLMLRKKNHPEICGIKHSFTMLMKSVGQKFRKGSLGNSCLGVSELGAVGTHWDCSNPNAWPGWGIPLQGGSITLNESWGWPLANNNRFFPRGSLHGATEVFSSYGKWLFQDKWFKRLKGRQKSHTLTSAILYWT